MGLDIVWKNKDENIRKVVSLHKKALLLFRGLNVSIIVKDREEDVKVTVLEDALEEACKILSGEDIKTAESDIVEDGLLTLNGRG